MNELTIPKLSENYKLRTHSNFTLLFQRPSHIQSIDVNIQNIIETSH